MCIHHTIGNVLVLKFYPDGDLEHYLRHANNLSYSAGIKMSLTLLRGLHYLHSSFTSAYGHNKPGTIQAPAPIHSFTMCDVLL